MERQRRLLNGETSSERSELEIVKKDRERATIEMAISLIEKDGHPVAFHHIARDVTEERRMQENLRYYLQEITRAQEEERKRISRELHDETAQAQLRRIYETVDPEGRPSFVDWVTSDEAREDPLVQYILPPKPVEGVEPAPAPKPAPKGFAGDRAVQTPTTLGSKPTQPASPEAWTAHFRGMTNDQLEAYIAQEP